MSHSIEVYSSGCYTNNAQQSLPDHAHIAVYQVFFCVEGEAQRTYEGNPVVVRKGDFLLVPKGHLHGMKKCNGATLEIKFDVFDELLAEQLQHLSGHACSTEGADYFLSQIVYLTQTQTKTPLALRLIGLYLETIFYTLLSDIVAEKKSDKEERDEAQIREAQIHSGLK